MPQFILNTINRFDNIDALFIITDKKIKIENISKLLITTNLLRSGINSENQNLINNFIRLLNNSEYISNNVSL